MNFITNLIAANQASTQIAKTMKDPKNGENLRIGDEVDGVGIDPKFGREGVASAVSDIALGASEGGYTTAPSPEREI